MELDCHRHGGYVIWLGGSPGAGWSYVVTPTSAPIGTPGATLGANDVGRPFRTKTLALTRARARIRQITLEASPPRGGGCVSIPDTTRRRTSWRGFRLDPASPCSRSQRC
jgi:hypothetical protein